MINKAEANAEKLRFNNVEFRHGEIENIPIGDNVADVIVSNCVFVSSQIKKGRSAKYIGVLKTRRTLQHNSDVVLISDLPNELPQKMPRCMQDVLPITLAKNKYISIIHEAGFRNISVQKGKGHHYSE